MSLTERLIKNSKISKTAILIDSETFSKGDMIQTPIPMLNVALSARVDGGLLPGLLQIAGPSKHFKSKLALVLAGAYLSKYQDGIILLYQSEFGMPEKYFTSSGVDPKRVVSTPVTHIEMLREDIANQLDGLERGDHVCIVCDSIGNLASRKEVNDALSGSEAADMTRAKVLKSLGRIITPHLTIKQIPMIAINHTYKELALHPRDIVGGGTGLYLSADDIWIMGRRQDKEVQTGPIIGYDFIINVEKSRTVKEKSKIPINVQFDGGIQKWSGMFDIAQEMGYIEGKSWYTLPGQDQKFRRAEVENDSEFWTSMLKNTDLAKKIEERYALGETQDDLELDVRILEEE